MDGGYRVLERAPDEARPASGLGWAGRLGALAVRPEPPAAAPATPVEAGWAAKLKAHVQQAGGLQAATALFQSREATPVTALFEALALLREQLLRERQRADAAEGIGRAQVAAAEAVLGEARARLAQREAELAEAQGRLGEAVKRAERAEKEAQAAQQGLRRLRCRGLIARILNAD